MRNGYVFEASMACPRPKYGEVHPPHRAECDLYNLGIILGDDSSYTFSFGRIGRDKRFWCRLINHVKNKTSNFFALSLREYKFVKEKKSDQVRTDFKKMLKRFSK